MSQPLDSEGGKPTYGIGLAGTVGLGANHEKRRVTLKNYGQVMALSPCRPGPFNIVPAVKANDTKRPLCAHVQVNEEAGGRLWLCCRADMLPQALSATLPTLESPLSFAMADEAKSSSCGQSFWLSRSVQPPLARFCARDELISQPS